jgi:hypothetical protein
LEKLRDLAPFGSLLNFIGIDLQVAFLNGYGQLERYSVIGVEFTSTEMAINQNDKFMTVELPFMALNVVRK